MGRVLGVFVLLSGRLFTPLCRGFLVEGRLDPGLGFTPDFLGLDPGFGRSADFLGLNPGLFLDGLLDGFLEGRVEGFSEITLIT